MVLKLKNPPLNHDDEFSVKMNLPSYFPKLTFPYIDILLKSHATYLLVCLWCCMTMFFSWMVSSNAVASDLRSEMDCGVAGRLHPWSSDNNSWTIMLKTQMSFGFLCTERQHKHLLSIKELFQLLKWIHIFFLQLKNKAKRSEL